LGVAEYVVIADSDHRRLAIFLQKPRSNHIAAGALRLVVPFIEHIQSNGTEADSDCQSGQNPCSPATPPEASILCRRGHRSWNFHHLPFARIELVQFPAQIVNVDSNRGVLPDVKFNVLVKHHYCNDYFLWSDIGLGTLNQKIEQARESLCSFSDFWTKG
jgi:hypothetical protein